MRVGDRLRNLSDACALRGATRWRYPSIVTFERITSDPDVMGGMPVIRGMRIPVATVVAMVADGLTAAEIVDDLPDLTLGDVAEALHYAAEAVRERQLPLSHSA